MTDDTHTIFGIPLDSLHRTHIEERIRTALVGSDFRRIATVNPEFLVRAHRDGRFGKNLLAADWRIPDGVGVVLDGLLSSRTISRYPGADLLSFILSESERGELTVFLIMRNDGLSTLSQTVKSIRERHPRLHVDGAAYDPASVIMPDEAREAAVVFCNFGAPEQEYLIESLRENPGNVRLAMGIGGSLDFVTGRMRRAPVFMRRLGLEWLFRLAVQPKRLTRILTATVLFPFLRLSDRIWPVNMNR